MLGTVGFIGCGNIARAMMGGMIKSGVVSPDQIIASNRSFGILEEVQTNYGVRISQDNKTVAKEADMLFLTVTSKSYPEVIAEIKDFIRDTTVVILIAVGETIEKNEKRFSRPMKIAKAMPNTPALVQEGITGIAVNKLVTTQDQENLRVLFESFGKVVFLDESMMDIVTAIGGSSPAFIYMFIEALADGAVLYGMPREIAYVIASQAVLGAAKMVLETGLHPGTLKDKVCSPGGVTIESVAMLEERGFRSAVIEAVRINMEKAKMIHG
mgnify:CR=1 FL=1